MIEASMNPIIQELAKKQGLTGANYLISSRELEQFAHQIVLECVLISQTSPDIARAERIMKQHFGVDP
jgi:hypothetical protein